jgi:hypothetical protein
MFRLRRWSRPAAPARRTRGPLGRAPGVELLGGAGLPVAPGRPPPSCRPQLEALEQRLVLSSSRPAAINYNGWLHVFTTGNDGHLYDHRTQDNVNWYWDDRGSGSGGFYGNPAVTTAWTGGNNRLHVYLTASNGDLYDCWYDGSWHLDDHGNPGAPLGDPGVMSYWVGSTDRIHVFASAYANYAWHVYDHWWDGGSWHWSDRGTGSGWGYSTPAPTAYWNGSVTQVHAYMTDVYGNLYDLYTNDDGSTWHFDNHGHVGAGLTGQPGVATYQGQLHVLVAGNSSDCHLYDHWWDGGSWHWSDRGSTGRGWLSAPAVTTYWTGSVTQLHAYVTGGGNGDLYDVYTNDGVTWHFDDHGNGGSYVNYNPGVAVDASNRLHVLMNANNGQEYDHWWDGSWHWTYLGSPNSYYGPLGEGPPARAVTGGPAGPAPDFGGPAADLVFAAPANRPRPVESWTAPPPGEPDSLDADLTGSAGKL